MILLHFDFRIYLCKLQDTGACSFRSSLHCCQSLDQCFNLALMQSVQCFKLHGYSLSSAHAYDRLPHVLAELVFRKGLIFPFPVHMQTKGKYYVKISWLQCPLSDRWLANDSLLSSVTAPLFGQVSSLSCQDTDGQAFWKMSLLLCTFLKRRSVHSRTGVALWVQEL